ncbi:MAG: altronate hydrolase [Verrucomicrobia bacterium 61-8]|nr:altronate dehydratase [Verrucomicrobiota bacterium]OJU98235.1 MAG: altronate hydrolase [Verrucomicrobia bacterium 61-8]
MSAPIFLRIHPSDNVVVALRAAAQGDTFDGVPATEPIPAGHKLAIRLIAAGEPVIKYGYPIGVASEPILAGVHVHSHNVRGNLAEKLSDLRYTEVAKAQQPSAPTGGVPETFQGYRRPDGRAATRNEIWIVNTVGCVNIASEKIAAAAHAELSTPGSGIDGVYTFSHPFGCSQLGDDLRHTQKVLAGLVRHPNAAAVLVLGLGCENNQMNDFLEVVGPQAAERIRWFNAQQVTDEIESGIEAVRELAAYVRQFQREPIPVSELILGMKCGGSDGFSGITANPLVGRIADRHTSNGGTVLLTEVPEMFGAERMLLERTSDEGVFHGVIDLVNDFRAYFQKHNEPIDENPSPGNKAGGITTLADKSLGCVQKGGQAPVRQVLPYGATANPGLGGLSLLQGPGNDGVSGTAMTIAGAHILLFTTGRGNPMGFPVPTVKISSNSDLATRKPHWIDFNAGPVADGTADFPELTEQLWRQIAAIASGEANTRNETRGHREIAIWKDGVTL